MHQEGHYAISNRSCKSMPIARVFSWITCVPVRGLRVENKKHMVQ